MRKFNFVVTFLLIFTFGPFSMDAGSSESNSGGGSRPSPAQLATYYDSIEAAGFEVDAIDHVVYGDGKVFYFDDFQNIIYRDVNQERTVGNVAWIKLSDGTYRTLYQAAIWIIESPQGTANVDADDREIEEIERSNSGGGSSPE